MESKLLKLLAPLEKDDQSLMKLDAIFAALHVENEDDIYRLATYFNEQNRATTARGEDTRSGAASSDLPQPADEPIDQPTDKMAAAQDAPNATVRSGQNRLRP